MRSLLSVVAAADNFPPHEGLYPLFHPVTREVYVPFHLTLRDFEANLLPVGLLRPLILLELQAEVEDSSRGAFEFVKQRHVNHDGAILEEVKAVHFADWVISEGRMMEVMGQLAEKLRSGGKHLPALRGWRNELYMIYAPPQSSALKPESSSKPFGNAAFALERAACGAFGLPTYGVHMTAYEGEGRDMKIWVPKRSATKSTYPGMLDNSVAGGIVAGMMPLETIIKECEEEASLPEDLVKRHVRATGATTYFYISDRGNLQPEIEYTYDLPLPPRTDPAYILPKPNDDEVESFDLLTVPETIEALHSGNFKPNSGLILVDFLVRHNLVTPEEEPEYLEIVWRTKRRLGFASPV